MVETCDTVNVTNVSYRGFEKEPGSAMVRCADGPRQFDNDDALGLERSWLDANAGNFGDSVIVKLYNESRERACIETFGFDLG